MFERIKKERSETQQKNIYKDAENISTKQNENVYETNELHVRSTTKYLVKTWQDDLIKNPRTNGII